MPIKVNIQKDKKITITAAKKVTPKNMTAIIM